MNDLADAQTEPPAGGRRCGAERLQDTPKACFPLPLASVGQAVQIEALQGGRGMVQRLTSMGLYAGAVVTVFNRGTPGPVIVSCGGTRLALGHGIARRVMVSPVSENTNQPD